MDDQLAPASVVFTPENVASINRAYAEAVEALGQAAKEELRAKLAEHMMSLARNGELNEQRLCSQSVLAILGHLPGRELGRAADHGADERR